MTDVGNEKWVSLEEPARYLNVKPVTVRDLIKKEKVYLRKNRVQMGI